jgi:hypothetical protein
LDGRLTDFGPIIYFRENCGNHLRSAPGTTMNDEKWPSLNDDALEKLLVERWLFRGALLVVMLAAGLLITYLGMEGFHTPVERLTVAALVGVTLGAGAAVFVMRNTDIRIHRELGRRRNKF